MRTMITGVGVPTLDRTYLTPDAVEFDRSVVARSQRSEGGGQVATALVAARRLGCAASLVATVGDDPEGSLIVDGLRRESVDTQHVERAEGSRSSTALVLVNGSGQRAILYDPGDVQESELSEAAIEQIARSQGVLLERDTAASRQAAGIARRHGGTVLLDYDAYLGEIPELLALCDIVIASEAVYEGRSHPDALREILRHGPSQAIITRGPDGAVGMTAAGHEHDEPAYAVDAVDTTGAGDVYHGAFLVAHLEGESLAESMEFAALAAGLSCQEFGGRAGIPSRDRVDEVRGGRA